MRSVDLHLDNGHFRAREHGLHQPLFLVAARSKRHDEECQSGAPGACGDVETVTLVPHGTTLLRIGEFPYTTA